VGFEFLDNWTDMMPRSGGHVVSVFGGGGKSSLIEAWADWYIENKIPVIVTTTVHVGCDQFPKLELQEWDGSSTELPNALFIGKDEAEYRNGISMKEVDKLSQTFPEHVILVEVDGSRSLPMKLHRDDEPLFPQSTTLAVAVAGLSAIGCSVEKALHRYNCDGLIAPEITTENKSGNKIWGWDETFELLTRENGYLARVPEGVPVMLAFCQMDDCDDTIGFFQFLDKMMEIVPLILVGDLCSHEPRMKAFYSTEHES
jgi:probable selenium-dependent hydroxylase accessory protein YqeC